MERNAGKGPIDPTRNFEQVRYSNLEARNEGLGSANQSFFIDQSSNINTNVRPPDYNMSVGARPVLNYSIQTGEEFALEFMRERVNPRQQPVPTAYGDPSNMTGYMDLKAILGISHAGSEGGSDISVVNSVEKGSISDYERKGSSVQEDKSYRDSTQSMPRAASRNNGNGSSRVLDSAPSGAYDSRSRIKFLCSFGGKILPRPSDGKLRYVGGETRIIRISRDISWRELMQKTVAIFNEAQTIKYQLPGEDLDALVSVSCDEDLQNMMEECNVLEDGGSQKPRMFLFSSSDLEDAQVGVGSTEGDSEMQYVVAVNGMDIGSRRNSIASRTNLDELANLNADRDANQIRGEFVGNIPSSTIQSSQPLSSSSAGFSQGSNLQSFQRENVNLGAGGLQHHPLSAPQLQESFSQVEGKRTASSSVSLPHGPGSRSSNYVANGENLIQVPLHGLPVSWVGVGEEHHQLIGQQMQDKVSAGEGRLKKDSSAKKLTEADKVQSQEKEMLFDDAKMKREGSRQKINETSHEGVSLHANDGLIPKYASREEASAAQPTAEVKTPSTTKIVNKNQLEPVKHSMAPGDVNPIFTSDPTDLSYLEPTAMPQRVFHSERIPREQLEQNRLSKSDDSMNPQLLISQVLSDHSQVTSDAVDNLQEGVVASQAEQAGSYGNASIIQDGTKQFQRHRDAETMKRLEPETTQASGLHTSSQMTTGKLHDDSLLRSTEFQWEEIASDKNNGNLAKDREQSHVRPQQPAPVVSRGDPTVNVSNREQGDILIDINDRFPRDILSDIFSVARLSQNLPNVNALHGDGAGLSLNMENHEPKHWSYFRNLAQNEFVRRDVSLMDQDHLGFSSPLTHVEERAPVDYSYPPLKADLSHVDSRYVEDIQQVPTVITGPSTRTMQTDYSASQLKGTESVLDVMNPRTPESEYEDGKSEIQNNGVPLVDLSQADIDISTLQIIKNEDLEELKELGSGTFGTVYHGKWRGTDVAIKRIKKSCFTGRSSEQERLTVEFWREADILSKLHHPNVVAFYGVVQDGPGGTLATVTEYMVNGSLRHVLLCKDRHLDRRKRLIIAMDAAFGMEYLHSKNIVHFDLKCDNLLVNLKDPARPICKVGDFGLSKIKRNTLVTGGVRGTLPWMAPELLNGSSNKVSEKVDVFSFGIVLWEILTGEEPYANMHYGAIIGGIVNNTLRPPVPNYCDPEWRLLMEQCWAPDPMARPCFTEIARRLRVMSTAAQSKPPK
ncbi:hypothetical protein CDL15_Pgr029121 [Punica granatum]|uniref:Protein kinase domain-containing protein n=1 Tax=Punica granatum TaxID=22663 RepID=A0A218XLP8_PUNGR|nr:hypothetical protein CDL15_Pgr029121 [Punica granatum]